jgi:hypothetical protein
LNTPFGNITTDPKLMHLTGEKLFFTCYNGEKPKPVVLVARPRIYAIFHRPSGLDSSNGSSESDESGISDSSDTSGSSGSSMSSEEKPLNNNSVQSNPLNPSPKASGDALSSNVAAQPEVKERGKRAVGSGQAMDCMCKCPAN